MASVLDTTGPASETSSADFRQVATVPGGVVAVVAISTAAAALITFDLSARAFVAAFFCAVLVVIAAVDLERGIIPNRIVVPAGIVVLLGDIAAQPHRWREWTIAAFASMLVALVISLGTRGGIGMGDVKLAFLLGAGLGVERCRRNGGGDGGHARRRRRHPGAARVDGPQADHPVRAAPRVRCTRRAIPLVA